MFEIITDRLYLRYFIPEDKDDLYDYLSKEQAVKYEPYEVFTREQCRKESIRRSKDKAFIAVCLEDTDKLIGNLYFAKQDYDTWELGYVFNPDYYGNGYATESARALMDYAFREWKARRITAMCNPENAASWKLLERLSMRREGHLHKNIYFKKDENDQPIWVDTYEYAILSEEWNGFVAK